jgi:hypothetical protein
VKRAFVLLNVQPLLFKTMKTLLKFMLCVLAGTIILSTQCKGQGSNARHVIDSLKITDPDEIAICNLYDDAVSEYLKELKAYTTGNNKPTQAQTQEVNKRFQEKEKEIKPQIEAFKKKVAANYAQLMNFVQFCSYESMRVMGGLSPYQKAMYKNYGAPANH